MFSMRKHLLLEDHFIAHDRNEPKQQAQIRCERVQERNVRLVERIQRVGKRREGVIGDKLGRFLLSSNAQVK